MAIVGAGVVETMLMSVSDFLVFVLIFLALVSFSTRKWYWENCTTSTL